ncbi:MAG: hypothetical protein LKJ76_01225 [Lachnospiraceae bacterium]|jgi:hypothetical protein|nr:hypothetical protein [Lachnospiraceae bacterium]
MKKFISAAVIIALLLVFPCCSVNAAAPSGDRILQAYYNKLVKLKGTVPKDMTFSLTFDENSPLIYSKFKTGMLGRSFADLNNDGSREMLVYWINSAYMLNVKIYTVKNGKTVLINKNVPISYRFTFGDDTLQVAWACSGANAIVCVSDFSTGDGVQADPVANVHIYGLKGNKLTVIDDRNTLGRADLIGGSVWADAEKGINLQPVTDHDACPIFDYAATLPRLTAIWDQYIAAAPFSVLCNPEHDPALDAGNPLTRPLSESDPAFTVGLIFRMSQIRGKTRSDGSIYSGRYDMNDTGDDSCVYGYYDTFQTK